MSKNGETPTLPASTVAIALAIQRLHDRVLDAATSHNTRLSYRSAIRHFQTWGGALPCDDQTLVRYLLTHAELLNPRTLEARLAGLAQWHLIQGFADPTAHPSVRKTLRGISRLYGRPARQARALALDDLTCIVQYLDRQATLRALRDSALLQLGFFGAFRRAELVALQVTDVHREQDGLLVTLPRSKTDQAGEGITKAIPWGAGAYCPVTALQRWLDAAAITEGPLFRGITRWEQVLPDALYAGRINGILRARAREAGLAHAQELASHSLRRGLATSAHRAGATFQAIKRQGGWQHDGTVQGYIEAAGRFEDNAAGVLLRLR